LYIARWSGMPAITTKHAHETNRRIRRAVISGTLWASFQFSSCPLQRHYTTLRGPRSTPLKLRATARKPGHWHHARSRKGQAA